MAVAKLASRAVGSIVKLKFDGALREFLIVHQGKFSNLYGESCNGTWLLMKDCLEQKQWHSSDVSDYENSDVHAYLNSTIYFRFDENIQEKIEQARISYRPGSGTNNVVNTGMKGLPAKIFLLSVSEVGLYGIVEGSPSENAKLSYFDKGTGTSSAMNKRVGKINGNAVAWWLRSPNWKFPGYAFRVTKSGALEDGVCSNFAYLRPALILPSELMFGDDWSVVENTAPTTPDNISIPDGIQGGSSITISWGVSSDAENNLEGYIVQRSTDGGSSWSQIYQGSGQSTTNTVAFGTASVMYRVKAYDTEGLESGWKTSSQVTVVNNVAPSAPASITVPNTVNGGKPLTVTWGSASDSDGNLSGYALERQVDGGEWSEIYRGTGLSFTDSITKGWGAVTYRVRAYDTLGAYSSYVTAASRTVNNNTAPTITCNHANGTDLGLQNDGFSVTYSVADADSDTVTVTEAIDGVPLRTHTPALGTNCQIDITGLTFMKVLNGTHTLTITASDGKASTTHSLTFSKLITAASVTLEAPMTADAAITLCVLSVTGSIPPDADYSVKVTNNGNDPEPVWEDCTAAVKNGINHVFANQTVQNGFAFNFKVEVERGASGQGGYITSVQGGFQ